MGAWFQEDELVTFKVGFGIARLTRLLIDWRNLVYCFLYTNKNWLARKIRYTYLYKKNKYKKLHLS